MTTTELSFDNDFYDATEASETVYGLDGNDDLTADADVVTLSGDAGYDTLRAIGFGATLLGGLDDDTYYVNSTSMVIEYAGEGIDTIVTAEAYWSLEGTPDVENLTSADSSAAPLAEGQHLVGNNQNNVITGSAKADIIEGGLGDDVLQGNGGGDTLSGGAGDDVYVNLSENDTIIETANGGFDAVFTSATSFSLAGFANVEDLISENYSTDEVLTGNSSDNIIVSGYMAEGSTLQLVSTLYGEVGNDQLIGTQFQNHMDGGAGDDILYGLDSFGYMLGLGWPMVNVVLPDGIGDDTLDGGAGNDVLDAGYGQDILKGGIGNDLLDGGEGADTMTGGAGDDIYVVDDLGDVIHEVAGGGHDTVYVLATIYGQVSFSNVESVVRLTDMDQIQFGDKKANQLTGGQDIDVMAGGGGNDTVSGGNGNDKLFGNVDNDRLAGGAGNDSLNGGSGQDRLAGGLGADNMTAGTGDDVLTGGQGRDVETGGAGADDFDFNTIGESAVGSGRDVITDFVHLFDDIDLSGIDASARTAGNQAFHYIGSSAFHARAGEVRFVTINVTGTTGDKTLIEGDVNGDGKADFQIELRGLKVLDAGDFIL
jgi:Ca2+-binding RTX toxin-like protein